MTDAGLTSEERVIVAEAYDQGVIKVIVATCSLAAGINLPARRVILHGARMGRDLVGPALLWVNAPGLAAARADSLTVGKCAVELDAKARTKWEKAIYAARRQILKPSYSCWKPTYHRWRAASPRIKGDSNGNT